MTLRIPLNRRTIVKVAGASTALPFLSGAAFGQAASGLPASSVRIWTFLSAEGKSPREVALKRIIERFKAANPRVSVIVESQPFQELETKFVAAAAQRRAPDLIFMRDTFLSLVSSRNVLADLNEVLSADFKRTAIPDMYEVFVRKSVFDGKLQSLPLWPSPAQTIFYRKDVLREIGLEKPPLTWNEFVPAAGRLTKGNRLGFGLPTSDNSVSSFLNIMTGFGPSIFDPATGQIDLTGGQALETAETVRALVNSKALSKTLLNATGDDIQDQFAAGRFAMAQAFTPRFPQFKSIAAGYNGNELAISPWPSFGNRPPAVLLGPYWTVGLSAQSENKAAAAAFLEALYSPEASMEWAKTAGLVPDRRSVMSDSWFKQPEASTIAQFVSLLSGPGAMVFPQKLPDVTKLFTVLNGALQELIGTDEAAKAILGRAKGSLGW